MTTVAKLLENIKRGALADKKVKSPGPAYDALCAVFPPKSIIGRREYGVAVNVATQVAEHLARPETRPTSLRGQLFEYLETLGVLIEKYERERFPLAGKGITGAEMLKHLMEEHGIRQVDLKRELGGQSIVSAVLSGRRKLNTRQIAALSHKFHVSPSVFFDS